jgi:SARP family transcriptional regulator, regulator of embCAB operon
MLTFNIMGPVEVQSSSGSLEVRGALQRTLLVTLLACEGKLVLTDSIMTEIWGEVPPRRAENALQAHVSRLRRALAALEPDRPSPQIVTWPSGYLLDLSEHEVDVNILARTVHEVRNDTDLPLDEATGRLRSALSLWRGPVFGGAVGGPICQSAAMRYEQTRLTALELLYDLELKNGCHSEIIDELSEHVDSERFNERLCEQLMVALYRAGRQADALAAYRKMWARLNEQLGIDTSPTLRKCEHAILSQDPVLESSAGYLALRI